jgi:hypothetical protein
MFSNAIVHFYSNARDMLAHGETHILKEWKDNKKSDRVEFLHIIFRPNLQKE